MSTDYRPVRRQSTTSRLSLPSSWHSINVFWKTECSMISAMHSDNFFLVISILFYMHSGLNVVFMSECFTDTVLPCSDDWYYIHTRNRFTAFLDFVWDYRVSWHQKGKTGKVKPMWIYVFVHVKNKVTVFMQMLNFIHKLAQYYSTQKCYFWSFHWFLLLLWNMKKIASFFPCYYYKWFAYVTIEAFPPCVKYVVTLPC